jgi:ABC-2 type transport system ATP-binding protein
MDEAQELADRVAIIAGGQIVAEGTPSSLGGRDTARARIRFALPTGCTPGDLPPAAVLGGTVLGGTVLDGAVPGGGVLGADADDGLVTVETADPTRALHRLTGWALQRGAVLDRLTVQRPSLEDTYLRLTGQDGRETR